MGKNKNKSSAFWWYMCHLQEEEYNKTGRVPPLGKVQGIAGTKWSNMSPEERQPYIDKDKNYKALKDKPPLFDFAQQLSRAMTRKESNPINNEKDAQNPAPPQPDTQRPTYQRTRGQILKSSLDKFIESTDDETLVKQKFYFFASNVMCAEKKNPISDDCIDASYYPLEIGIAEFSIADGITFDINKFTDAGDIPNNNARICIEHAKIHQIPLHDFSLAIGCCKDVLTGAYDKEKRRQEYDDLVCDLMDIFNKAIIDKVSDCEEGKNFKIMFSREDQILQNKGCIKKIGQEAGYENFADEIEFLSVNDLFFFLCKKKGFRVRVFVNDMLDSDKFSYDERCEFHTVVDNRYCAVNVAKRFCWLAIEKLCELYGIEYAKKHKPENYKAKPSSEESIDNWATNWGDEVPSKIPKSTTRYFYNEIDQPLQPTPEPYSTSTIAWPDDDEPTRNRPNNSQPIPTQATNNQRESVTRPPSTPMPRFVATDVRLKDGRLSADNCRTTIPNSQSPVPSSSTTLSSDQAPSPSYSSSSTMSGSSRPNSQGLLTSPFRSRDERRNGSSDDVKPLEPDFPRAIGRGRGRIPRPTS